MNLMIFGFPELIDGRLGVGVSIIEYPGGVRYSVLFISLVLLLRSSLYIRAMSLYSEFGSCFLIVKAVDDIVN